MTDTPETTTLRVRVSYHAEERLAERCGLYWTMEQWHAALAPHVLVISQLKPRRNVELLVASNIIVCVRRLRTAFVVTTVLTPKDALSKKATEYIETLFANAQSLAPEETHEH